ncbi:MAG: DUF4340 domain-containing protein [Candidatus Omnitrophota bacterium]
MKLKQIIVLGIIFVSLLGVLFAKKIFMRPETEDAEYKKLQISFDASDIYVIEAKKGKDLPVLRIEKKEDDWFLTSHWSIRARVSRIERLFSELPEILGEQRSSSEEFFTDYAISDDKALSITLFDKEGEIKEKLFIGLKKPSEDSSFLRRGDSKDVYLINKDIFQFFGIYGDPEKEELSAKWWMELIISKISDDLAEDIDSLKVVRSIDEGNVAAVDIKKEVDPEKELNQWVSPGKELPFDIDAQKIKRFIKGMNNRRGREAKDPAGEGYGFGEPFAVLTFGVREKEPMEIIVGGIADEAKGCRYMRTPEGFVYVVDNNALKNIAIDISSFFVDNPLRISKGELKSIKIKSTGETADLDEKLIDKNAKYIKRIEGLYIEAVALDKKYAKGIKGSAKNIVDIKKKDASSIKLYGKREDDKFLIQVEGRPEVFHVSKPAFEGIFEPFGKLNLTK